MNIQFLKNKLSFSLTLLIIIYSFNPGPSIAAPEKKNTLQQRKTKIVVYNLNIREKSKTFRYYSGIIPFSLAKNLREYGAYDIEHKQEVQIYKENISDIKEKARYIEELKKLSKSSGADYVITGACEIHENTLIIDLQIFNVRGSDFDYINKKSMESGVILKDTIDSLALNINESIIRSLAKNRERYTPSPYLSLYRKLSKITFGIDTGQVRIIGDWSDNINDTDSVNSYIQFNLFERFYISTGAEYMATNNRDMLSTYYNALMIWEFYLDLIYPLKVSKYYGISLSLGSGAAISKMYEYLYSMDEGLGPHDNTYRTKDATLRGGISIFFDIMNLHVRFGTYYKRIFYDKGVFGPFFNCDGPLDMYTVYAGLGYNI